MARTATPRHVDVVAVISTTSADNLGLAIGKPAQVLIKASSVLVEVPVHLRAAHPTDRLSPGQSIVMRRHVTSRSEVICHYVDGLVQAKIDAYGYDERVRRQQS